MAKDKTASKNKAAKIKKPTLKKKQSKTSKSSGMSLYSNLATVCVSTNSLLVKTPQRNFAFLRKITS